MDLAKLNDEQRTRLGRWFKFFSGHRENLLEGEFRPFGEEFHSPEMLVHRDGLRLGLALGIRAHPPASRHPPGLHLHRPA